MSELVCPECGHDQFTATLTTRTEYTYSATTDFHGPIELSSEIVDGGDLGDIDAFECADCGEEYNNLDADHLVTREQYDSTEYCPSCDATRILTPGSVCPICGHVEPEDGD